VPDRASPPLRLPPVSVSILEELGRGASLPPPGEKRRGEKGKENV